MAMRKREQKNWYMGFFISHVVAYTIAWLQTFWIVWEIRRKK